jgi:integrase
MPHTVRPRGKRFELRVKHALLPKPFYFTFDTDVEANNYGEQLDALLARGIVPNELLAASPRGDDPLLIEVIRAYTKEASPTDSDDALLSTMLGSLVGVRISSLSFQWADNYVRDLKLKRNLAPGSIRKRVGVLARVVDWHQRRVTPRDQVPPANALRLLPRGYSLYTREETAKLEAEGKGRTAKRDQVRDKRLAPGQEQAILAALDGMKNPERERALVVDPAFKLMFQLILATGMRLREAYTLRVDQVDLQRRIINVEGSKGHRGAIKPRTVPIGSVLAVQLRAWMVGRIGRLFPFWDGEQTVLSHSRASHKLSVRFGVLFDYAGVDGFTEHDLRHEATCRWVQLRDPKQGGCSARSRSAASWAGPIRR